MLSVEVCRTQAGIEAVAQALQQPHSWEQLTFVLVAANSQQDVLLWDLKASAEHGFEVGFTTALSEAGHLSSTGHLHTKYHVGTGQA